MKSKEKLIEIVCPICKRFLCYVPSDSDVWCPRGLKWIYQGLGGNEKASVKAVKDTEEGKQT